jgi:hypothetical protein
MTKYPEMYYSFETNNLKGLREKFVEQPRPKIGTHSPKKEQNLVSFAKFTRKKLIMTNKFLKKPLY